MSASRQRDFGDEHVDRWAPLFTDEDGFDREVEGALVRMDKMVRLSDKRLRDLVKDDVLSHEEFKTLHVLLGSVDQGKPATPAQLAERAGVTRAGMTSRIDRLVTKGMVTRREDPDDRRSILVEATDEGRAAWDRTVHHWSEAEQVLFRGLSVTELTRLNALLRKAFESIDDITT
ncbi:MarR family transcriptional regulator [Luteipulveratus sp. YIM 133132]|uniref:MarR family winged helix-turn-helix transcriptional regulator n=1 Tax=Luteipulveratus flavus TaxID=3031728 RepID=UPI0023AFF8D8|nr:MarR family transcriptional regulator [Luteipulveratus sp. YIM 133132]MDE9367866.1 MarR family transcriptional regulator [Luteipulveratus sp. YIM 133132]